MIIRLAQTAPRLGNSEYNFEQCRKLIEEAAADGIELIVFPELSLTGYLLKDMVALVGISAEDPMVHRLAGLSTKVSVLMGLVEHGEDQFFYNSAFYFEDGRLARRYRKAHLPTYGMFDEGRYFARGNRIAAFDTRFGRAGIMICEDAWHPINPYILCQDGAQLLVIVSNSPVRGMTDDGGDFWSVQNWRLICQSYALLFSSFVVYVNRVGCEDGISFSGSSLVADPHGRLIASLPFLEEAVETVELDLDELARARIGSPILADEKFLTSLNELERIRKATFGN
ncbi:MAG: nitrilase-related carbon-nitrogen hydrolase [Candidatus Glassbacteria bacterium]